MAEEKELKQAQAVFKTLCEVLDEHNWYYSKDEENFSIRCNTQGDDFPIEIRIKIDVKMQLVSLYSQMPFAVPEDRRSALAVAVSRANDGLADGNFDYNYLSGGIVFRMTACYMGSLIGRKLFAYMLMCSCTTVDVYNDKFFMVCKNKMSNEEIADFIK